MDIKVTGSIAEIVDEGVVLSGVDDALDIIGNCGYRGADSVVIYARNIVPEFFDLSTRIAGEVLQKFTQYDMRIAIVVDTLSVESRALRDFMRESNRGKTTFFVTSVAEALECLM